MENFNGHFIIADSEYGKDQYIFWVVGKATFVMVKIVPEQKCLL